MAQFARILQVSRLCLAAHRKSSDRRQRNWDHAQQHTQTIAKRLSDVNGLPEKEAKKLLGVMDEDDDDNWD